MADTENARAKVGTINLKYNEVIEETDSDLTNKTTKTVKQVSIKDMSEFEFQKEMKMLLQFYDLDVTFKLKPIQESDDEDEEEYKSPTTKTRKSSRIIQTGYSNR